jgi:hypothetical protein
VPADIEPPELQRQLDFAERSREGDWSLRSALVRYAQPEPERASAVLSLVRRIEWALHQHADLLRREGAAIWSGVVAGDPPPAGQAGQVTELLRALRPLDELGDSLARWAADRAGDRPDTRVDDVTAEVARSIEALGVPDEEPPPRPTRG